MPRSAAAMLGLTLVAVSIGFNTMRYPAVWEMVGAGRTGQAEQTAAASRSEEANSSIPSQQPEPPAQLAKPIEMQPASESTDSRPPSPDDGGTDLYAGKPLVPVAPISPPGGTGGNQPAGQWAIRRLPPVEQGDSRPTIAEASPAYAGSIPIYPSTGIE